ncbi:MAG: LTA synthase family protein [Gammaproteobacteria bacterium]|nr:LTA synthase family protein [Gammaproteobacteria bacterium]
MPKAPRGESAAGTWPVVAWAALLCPSWLVLVTPSIPLYLRNQEELQHDPTIIAPFLAAALLIPTVLLPVFLAAMRGRFPRAILWCCLYVGFPFLGWLEVRGLVASSAGEPVAAAVATAAYALAVWASSRWWDLRQAIVPFALVAAGFVATDIYGFFSGRVVPAEMETVRALDHRPQDAHGEPPPNLYHIVFDEYQTDLFERTLDARLREELGGFVFFDDAVTAYGRTRMSLASIFGGKSYDPTSSQAEYLRSAFAGPASMFTLLERAGYQSEAYLHGGLFALDLPFHTVRYHRARVAAGWQVRRAAFAELWTYAHLPEALSAQLISQENLERLKTLNAMNPETPIKSVYAFRSLLEREPDQAGRGRYVLAHLILPHYPNVVWADCSHGTRGTRTGTLDQARCANRLMVDLVDVLKDLDRFRESMIVFQSDHGARYAVREGLLVLAKGDGGATSEGWCGTRHRCSDDWNTARSREALNKVCLVG